jgi:protein involved in polysaccharide export with SLBB domain
MLTRLRIFVAAAFLLLAAALPAAAQTILAPGDRVLIALPGEAAFGDPVALNADGRVLLPEVGEMELSGLSLPEAEARLQEVLGVAFRTADQLDLRLVERRMLIRVLGYVNAPGVVDIGRGENVQVAVAAAGGPALGAQLDKFQHRRDGVATEFDYKRYLETGDDDILPELDSLDTIFAPASPLLGNVQVAVDAGTFESTGDTADASEAVSVFGEVIRPGAYSHREGMTVLDAILRAGGVTRYAGVEQIRVIADGEPSPVNLKDYLDTGDDARMPLVGPGATIFVPSETAGVAAGARTVYVMGEAPKPGAYELIAEASLLDVLANAGGPTRYADTRNIRILRAEGGVVPFDLDAFTEGGGGLDSLPEIRPGDAIFLPEAAQEERTSWLTVPASRAIYLLGAVNRPGRYEWSAEMSLLDLLAEGGGPTGGGDPSAIEVSTPTPDGALRRTMFDLDGYRAGAGGALPRLTAGSVVLVPELPQDPSDNKSRYILQSPDRSIYVLGSVGAPGRYAFEPGLSLLDVLSAANGPLQNSDLRNIRLVKGKQAVAEARKVDLSLFFQTGDFNVLPPLSAGDSIFVPSVDRPFIDQSPQDTVRVLGAVGQPGRYIFNDEMTILDLLAQAGGPTGDAYNSAIVVVNLSCCRDQARTFDLESFAQTGDMDLLPLVRPGDTIYVPDISQSPFRQFMDGVTDITRIVSLVVLLLAL